VVPGELRLAALEDGFCGEPGNLCRRHLEFLELAPCAEHFGGECRATGDPHCGRVEQVEERILRGERNLNAARPKVDLPARVQLVADLLPEPILACPHGSSCSELHSHTGRIPGDPAAATRPTGMSSVVGGAGPGVAQKLISAPSTGR
jgi:hypothetical protein